MSFTVRELASLCEGEVVGNPDISIKRAASLLEADEGDVSFFGDPRYVALLRKTRASAVFVPSDFAEKIPQAQIRVANPAKAFEQLVRKLAPDPVHFAPGIHPTAVVDPSARIDPSVSIQPKAVIERGVSIGANSIIGAGCYIGHETTIGSDSLVYPNVTVRERSIIGSRVILHSGVVIGADGFGFEMVNGRYEKIPQLGFVQIDDDVEIGANSTIDRGRFGRTWIQKGAKIDNLVQIAHNVIIGEHTALAAQVGIAGSTRVGKYVVMAGQVGLVGHIEIGDKVVIAAQAGVSKSLSEGTWFWTPAVPLAKAKEQLVWIHRLGKLFARVKALEEKGAAEEKSG